MKGRVDVHRIEIFIHEKTGAKIPYLSTSTELVSDRSGFTLEMLIRRWKKKKFDVLKLIEKYNTPAFTYEDSSEIFFFEEYIQGIEEKEKIDIELVDPKLFLE